jgi:molecular chaperone GrpE
MINVANTTNDMHVADDELETHDDDAAQTQIEELQAQLAAAVDREKRALADYQNLVRRTQAERGRLIKLAGQEFVSGLLQPLDHLGLAAEQLKDKGLNMVIQQFWSALNDSGLQEIQVLGQEFDPEIMEVVDRKGEGETVIKVVKKGYRLNGEVIQIAQVIIGDAETKN